MTTLDRLDALAAAVDEVLRTGGNLMYCDAVQVRSLVAENKALREVGPWAEQLLKAERENRCGDAACQTRRTAAAVAVLTGWKEHQDLCWAVEVFQVEAGIRDPETVGPQPGSGAALHREDGA